MPCILMFHVAASAAAWVNIGPYGGLARSLAGNESAVYVVNPRNGVFRSDGQAWSNVFDALRRGVTATSIAVDATTNRVYAGTTAGLFRSDDRGASWQQLTSDAVIAIDARSDSVIASTLNGLVRSDNAGETWTWIESPPSDVLTSVLLVRFDPARTGRVAAAIAGNLFVSDDAGDSWQRLNATGIVAVTFGDVLYAAGPGGVYACGGACALVSAEPVVDVAFWRGRVYTSRDAPPVPLALLATSSALFAGTTAGVFVTVDGTSWTARNDGLANVRIAALAILGGSLFSAVRGQGITALASDGSALYAAFDSGGVYMSVDREATWRNVSAGLPSRNIIDVAAEPVW